MPASIHKDSTIDVQVGLAVAVMAQSIDHLTDCCKSACEVLTIYYLLRSLTMF